MVRSSSDARNMVLKAEMMMQENFFSINRFDFTQQNWDELNQFNADKSKRP